MTVRFFCDDVLFSLKNKRKISNWLKNVANAEEKKIDNLSYVFVTDNKILEINSEYLKHDYYTDIITFDNSLSGSKISGEMYISIDTVKQNAKDYKVEFENELLRVLVHGLLHLCGYNDDTKESKKLMRQKENDYIKLFIV